MSTRGSGSGTGRRERAAALQANRQRAERRRRQLIWATVIIVVLAAGGIIAGVVASSGGKKKSTASPGTGALGPEGVAVQEGTPLASLSSAATGQTVQGVQCNTEEKAAYHIHTHLSVYVNGALRPIAPGVGIVKPQGQQTPTVTFYGATNCYYWLHVHTQDGVIHVESPTQTSYTLGQFFAIWGQNLTSTQVGPATGKLSVFVDGKPFTGDPASITLGSRKDIQIDVGTLVPYQKVDWSHSQL